MLALAQPHATEIETQNRQPEMMQCFRRLIDDFIVHRSTKQRMRMTDCGRKRRVRALFAKWHSPQERFKAARSRPDEQKSIEELVHVFSEHQITPRDKI